MALTCGDGTRGAGEGAAPSTHRDYLGRYRLSDDLVLLVGDQDGRLTVLLSFWLDAMTLEPVAEDRFRMVRHPELGFSFTRDPEGRVTQVEGSGYEEIADTARRLAPEERLPVEALLDGRPEEALTLLDATEKSPGRALGLAKKLLTTFPSRSATAGAFLDGLAQRHPASADVQTARGVAWVSAGDRRQALPAFRRALDLQEDNGWARFALRNLDPDFAAGEAEGWTLPFALADLFAPPTAEEVRQVRRDWRGRDLSPKEVTEVRQTTLDTDHGAFRMRVISHLVHGKRHYSAILVPADATPGCCPVMLDVRGIRWDYRSRRLTAGLGTLQILRDAAPRFVIAVPGLRGEALEIDGETYLSEGDRTDGWDGAADDSIALLSVVLETVPEADPERAGIFGLSRGASVALLAAARDPRIDCAVAWAGPADWFRLIGTWGWTFEEEVREGLRQRWQPGQGSGSAAQFIEWFLRRPIDDGLPSLPEVRARVTASSPLYFADSLPPSDLHYGVEDRSVVVANGAAFRNRLNELGRTAPDYRVTLHPRAAHTMPYPLAYDQSRDFLLRHLVETAPGRHSRTAPADRM